MKAHTIAKPAHSAMPVTIIPVLLRFIRCGQ